MSYPESCTRTRTAVLISSYTFVMAFVLHGVVSILVGLLYGAMLPMFPRRPIVLGGLIAPVLWSGLLYIDPRTAESAARQAHRLVLVCCLAVAFGIVAGLVSCARPHSYP